MLSHSGWHTYLRTTYVASEEVGEPVRGGQLAKPTGPHDYQTQQVHPLNGRPRAFRRTPRRVRVDDAQPRHTAGQTQQVHTRNVVVYGALRCVWGR